MTGRVRVNPPTCPARGSDLNGSGGQDGTERDADPCGAGAPKAGAIAGIAFAVLLTSFYALIGVSVPENPEDAGLWLSEDWSTVGFALNLVPFAGIAFLWFIGVLRDRMGTLEDRFFSTVFLGSGLLFLAMLFAATAIAGGVIAMYGTSPGRLLESGLYSFGRLAVYQITNIFALKMAGCS